MPDGSQLAIRVDLARAMQDEKQRIAIQANDVVMLDFKPSEAVLNTLFNYLSPNLTFISRVAL
jgi:hypothetical protein